MKIDRKEISSILTSSGNGWFDTADKKCVVFRRPRFSLSFSNNNIRVISDSHCHSFNADPLYLVERYVAAGYFAVGYIGYNYLEFTNSGFKTSSKKDGIKFPQIYFHFYKDEDLIDLPYRKRNSIVKSGGEGREFQLKKSVSNLTKEQYLEKLEKIKKYIASGDIYQVNLSQRFYSNPIREIIPYFFKLYDSQPVPFAAYIDFNDFQLLSGSMELFLSKRGNRLLTKPIKGTAKRGRDSTEDEKLKIRLGESEKERAENLMIVDLMRNDISRICEYGSVNVNRLFEVKSYKTLFQMESEVEGRLKNGISLSELVYNTFPPGSVTGAPKRRALQIIDDLEPHYRGPYCGAVCFLKPDGDFSMSVAIRIKVNTPEKSIFWVGGGIVWDSDPEAEYEETILKSNAITNTDSSMYR